MTEEGAPASVTVTRTSWTQAAMCGGCGEPFAAVDHSPHGFLGDTERRAHFLQRKKRRNVARGIRDHYQP